MEQVLAVLFVLAALCGVLLFLQKRGFAVINRPLRKQDPRIQQLDRMRLTPQHSVHLLLVDERRLLIAVHPQGITMLEESEREDNRVWKGNAC